MTAPASFFQLASQVTERYLTGKPPIDQAGRERFFAFDIAKRDLMIAMQSPEDLDQDVQRILATKGKLSQPQRSAAEIIVAQQTENAKKDPLSDAQKKGLRAATQLLSGAAVTKVSRKSLFTAPKKPAQSAPTKTSCASATLTAGARRGK